MDFTGEQQMFIVSNKSESKFWQLLRSQGPPTLTSYSPDAGINFIHNGVPPQDLHQKFAPTLGLLHSSFCQGGRDLLGQLLRGQHWSVHDVHDVWNFRYNGWDWQLTTLWDLMFALKFYVFKAILVKAVSFCSTYKIDQQETDG